MSIEPGGRKSHVQPRQENHDRMDAAAGVTGASPLESKTTKFETQFKDHARRATRARAMGGADKLARRRKPGVLNARERIDYLLDPGTFRESGLFGVSYIPEMRESTPSDGKVTGFGKVGGRRVGVVGYDFTVKASSSSYTNNRKMAHIKDTGGRRGCSARTTVAPGGACER